MIKLILLGVLAIVVVFLIVTALQPPVFSVMRTTMIAAPPATVFPLINDFHHWAEWSPWEHLDPAMKKTYSGAAAGTGAVYQWAGNKQAGEGRMAITDSQPNDHIRIDLEFLQPFKAENVTAFALKPEGAQTVITWTMTGQKNFMFKAMGLFMSMDKMIGGDFERGLSNLKALSEKNAK